MVELSVDPKRLEELLTYCLDFAKEMLARRGAFLPFGASLRRDGQVCAVAGFAGDPATPLEVHEVLHRGLRADFEKGVIVAAALATDVTIPGEYSPDFPDGIRVHLECAGYSRFIYTPYRIQRQGLIRRMIGTRATVECAPHFAVETDPSLLRGLG